jgi:glycosyltransferase involved in cell wall biosynthesis
LLIGIDASRATVAQRTGTEAYSWHLIRGLLELEDEHHYRLYFNQAPPAGLLPGAVAARCESRVMPFPRLWTHVRLSAEMAARAPDVLFVPSHVLPIVHPRASVVTVHDLGHRMYPAAHTDTQRRYLEWSTHYHVAKAAHLVADSQATKQDLIQYYGADESRITAVHLGVGPEFGPVTDPAELNRVRAKYGLGPRFLLCVGTLQPRKNLVRLIEAFAEVCRMDETSSLDGTQLVLVGKRGWLSDGILRRGQELGLGDRVVFPGYVPEVDLPALYGAASLFVMPSLYEGFCIPVLEAMACGTAVACSATSSLPEVVGGAAILFDPLDVAEMASAIARVLTDEGLRRALAVRGEERASAFTWSRTAQQVLGILEHAAGEGRQIV